MITPYVNNIENETLGNDYFRKEVFTGEHLQMTVMSLLPGEDSSSDRFYFIRSIII
jgi:hypothetical protein